MDEIEKLRAEIAMLREELDLYRDAAKYDVKMSGSTFSMWNRSALDRARKITEERIKREND